MSSLIMSNGEYSDLKWYAERKKNYHKILCTDGAAGRARQLGMIPDMLIGDMDSIQEDDRIFMEQRQVPFFLHPSEKDFTDTFLAFELAEKSGLESIAVWGATGGRLDHTIANLFCAVNFVKRGMDIRFEAPGMFIYMVRDRLQLFSAVGDTVSVFALDEKARGVTLAGFQYPLDQVVLDPGLPIGISNVVISDKALIAVSSGVLAVIHYNRLVEVS